jgi:class 3 adenylate cyclase/tetratricopeptide (TPR) repeat protein
MIDGICQRCGAPLPPDARFCPRCGTPVALPTTAERRMVTVLFADLADSTILTSRLDPERAREVLGVFYAAASEELRSMRGRAEKFVGDAVMAVWGAQSAREDDALRAVRAGVLIRDRVERLHETLHLPEPLRVRVGLSSGFVAVGEGPVDQFLVSGATVNLAARLQGAAQPGEVLVSTTTRQLTELSVTYGEPREIEARGFDETITGWPVASLTARSTRRTIPLVGRQAELNALLEIAQHVAAERRPHLVRLVGEAGIGKSRLVEELVAALPEETAVLAGRATEFAEDVTYAPIAEMIRRQIEVSADAPPEEVRRRLAELVDDCCDPTERQQVAARVGLVLGLGVHGAPGDSGDERDSSEGRSRAAEIRSGLRRLINGLAQRAPLIMIVDDAHRARPELLDLLGRLLREGEELPLVLILAGRDEMEGDWDAGLPGSTTLRVAPLSDPEAEELARNAGNLDDPRARTIAAHAGGNPFFVIETTGMLLDRRMRGQAPGGEGLPATVQAVIASRLDHLPAPARDLARRASVLTRPSFDLAELSLIADPDPDTLAELEEAEVLVQDRTRRDVWRFRHELLRDVAYEALPKRERQRLHLQLAEALDERDPERYPASVAHHLASAARAALDLDPRDRELADRAIHALRAVGDRFRRRTESHAAIEQYERALSLAGPRETWGEREARILSFIGECRYWLGEFEEARSALSRARELAPASLWVTAHAARFLGDIRLNVDGDPHAARTLFAEAVAAADELGEPHTRARAHLMAGWAPYWVGDLAGARDAFEASLAIVRENPAGDPGGEARALVALTSVVTPTGTQEEVLEMARRALEIGRTTGDAFIVAIAQETIGSVLHRLERMDEAFAAQDEAVRIFRELGARWELASALGDRASVHRSCDRLHEAQADLREALAICRELGELSLVTWTTTSLGTVALFDGDRIGAEQLADEAAAVVPESDPGEEASILQLRVLLALADGDEERAQRLAMELLEIDRDPYWPNPVAARVWWVGRLLGEDLVGGHELETARNRLEHAGWKVALSEPDRTRAALERIRQPSVADGAPARMGGEATPATADR